MKKHQDMYEGSWRNELGEWGMRRKEMREEKEMELWEMKWKKVWEGKKGK